MVWLFFSTLSLTPHPTPFLSLPIAGGLGANRLLQTIECHYNLRAAAPRDACRSQPVPSAGSSAPVSTPPSKWDPIGKWNGAEVWMGDNSKGRVGGLWGLRSCTNWVSPLRDRHFSLPPLMGYCMRLVSPVGTWVRGWTGGEETPPNRRLGMMWYCLWSRRCMSCSGKLLGSKTGTLMCLQKKGMTEAGEMEGRRALTQPLETSTPCIGRRKLGKHSLREVDE